MALHQEGHPVPEIRGITEVGTVLEVEESLLEAQLSCLLSEAVVIALGTGATVPEVGVMDHTGHALPLPMSLQSPLGISAVALHAKAELLTLQEVGAMAIPMVAVDLLIPEKVEMPEIAEQIAEIRVDAA